MKRLSHIYTVIALILSATGCVRENAISPSSMDGEGVLQMEFGTSGEISIETKATLGETDEGQIKNFYAFVFAADGHLAGSQFFDAKNRKTTREMVTSSLNNSWYIDNTTSSGSTTNGIFRLKCNGGDGMKVYMLANLDMDIFNVSSDMLAHSIEYEHDLMNFTGYLEQLSVNRNGNLTMTGKQSGIGIQGSGESGSINVTICDKTIMLGRTTAKIRFIFKEGKRPDELGHVIKKFKPEKWKVVNVPRATYLLSYAERGIDADSGEDCVNVPPETQPSDYSICASDFFDTDFSYFEDFPANDRSGFSFYMLENRQKPKKSCNNVYQNRSRSIKDATGLNRAVDVTYELDGKEYRRTMRMFEYANDFSTYVIVTGKVEMELDKDPEGTILGGDVQYIIHLGDWNAAIDSTASGDRNDTYSGVDNFNVERNTSYTYTVTVNSVNSIRVEVRTSNDESSEFEENQPGATGDITIAKEEIAICDSHYSTKTLTFSLSSFFDENGKYAAGSLTWFTETPFATGGPDKGLANLDYKWVHFRMNKTDGEGNYLSSRRKYTPRTFTSHSTFRSAEDNAEGDGTPGLAGYHNDGAMDVVQLVDYIKGEVIKYNEGKETAFDHKGGEPADRKIKVTAFIDEYYYPSDPLTGKTDPVLWKKFVNQSDRRLHILSNSQTSKDMESMITGSIVTIQQKPIMTIYSTDETNTGLLTAWGAESVDEFEGTREYWKTNTPERRRNDSDSNGLSNTCIEWGLCDNSYAHNFIQGMLWSDYMDPEVANEVSAMNSDHNYLRYACMERNRDNNGDGVIDRDEIRWYMASINQLIGMYIGNDVLNDDVRLYNKSPEDKNSDDEGKLQQHVISSTSYTQWISSIGGRSSNDPTMLWAEEGLSTSQTNADWQHIRKASVRCVRNLGYLDGKTDESYSLNTEPTDYLQMEQTVDGDFMFSSENLNSMAHRYYTSSELALSDEHSMENRLYRKFEIYREDSQALYPTDNTAMKFETYNAAINDAVASGKPNPYCPEGYRTPNQVETAVMRYYLGTNKPAETFSRTYWSLGRYGSNSSYAGDRFGFIQNTSLNLTVNRNSVSKVRCIRDVK